MDKQCPRLPILADKASTAAGATAPYVPWSDPRDLVARAFALLDEDSQAWRQRRQAGLVPGMRR